MDDVLVLNHSLEVVGIIDTYKSLIWANRYNEVGDCELYVPASTELLNVLKKTYYLARLDDDMVCQIRYIELTTNAEEGNYIIVKGIDTKGWLDQRVVWNTISSRGLAETFIRNMVDGALGSAAASERQMVDDNGNLIFGLAAAAGFTEVLTIQVSYSNIGEKVREICNKFGWGYKTVRSSGKMLFELFKGADRSGTVIFSDEFENLSATSYVEDDTNLGNVALVAGEGQGSARKRITTGDAESIDRFELYVDAKDISATITYEELTDNFSGSVVSSGGGYVYRASSLNIQIMDDAQLAELQEEFPDGEEVIISGVEYYQITDADVADVPSAAPETSDNVVLRDYIYKAYLYTRGLEKRAEYGATKSFEGTVEPYTTFMYKTDYFLGDIVSVQNSFGISVNARIVEVVECNDDNGYSVEPKFEYHDLGEKAEAYILVTESGDVLLTESGDQIEAVLGGNT